MMNVLMNATSCSPPVVANADNRTARRMAADHLINTLEVSVDADDGDTNNDMTRPLPAAPNARTEGNGRKRKGDRKRHGARNQHRHKFFVKWLIQTFDLESSSIDPSLADGTGFVDPEVYKETPTQLHQERLQQQLQQCHHILDVAGGKGEVSARLCMCHRQRVVMVDPRPADIVDCFERLVLPKIPNKWQRKLRERIVDNPTLVKDQVEAQFRQLTLPLDEWSLKTSPDLQAAVQNASLIVGLHADGATEAIVDVALKFHKPFVVVPCCVFPNLFSSRFVPSSIEDGQVVPVRSHEQFCKYLALKDSRFRTEELPFEGRNIAIWWDGKD
jgi:hypothetical protein